MEKRIVYQNDDGRVAVIVPNYEGGYTIDNAKKAVPTGRPYAIIDASDVPSDRTARNYWTVDVADLTDGVGQ